MTDVDLSRPQVAPPRPTPPAWSDPTIENPPDRSVVIAVAVVALATDAALRAGLPTLGGAVLVVTLAAALVATKRVTNARALPLVAAAAALGIAAATRTSPAIVAPDLIATCGLLVLAATLARGGDPVDVTVPRLVERGAASVVHAVTAPGFVAAARPRGADRAGLHGAVRGALLAAPIVAVLAALLASADAVFASLFRFPVAAGDLAGHLALLVFGAWGGAGLLRAASGRPPEPLPARPRWLGRAEAGVVLGAVLLLFVAFAAAQVVAALGGATHVLETRGLTYAEYARSGFFQLLVVAALTLAVILAIRATLDGELEGRLLLAAEAAIALTIVIVAVAIRRLALYEDAYGLTMLRLYATLGAVWVGTVFALLAVHLASRPSRQWFVPVSIACALAAQLVLHVVNPEALVVRRNVAHYERTGRFDAAYVLHLGDDAVPTTFALLDRLEPADATYMRNALCLRDGADPGPWAFNLSAHAARDARADHCGPGPG